MRLLIVSAKQHLADYSEFAEAIDSVGVEALVVHDLKFCFLCERSPLHIVPFPKLLEPIKRFNPDFVMMDLPYYVPQMVKLVNRRVLFHIRAEEWREFHWDKAMHPYFLIRMYQHYLERVRALAIEKTDLILPNSKWLQEQIKQYLPNYPAPVLYVGIDAKKWVRGQNATLGIKHPAAVGLFKFNIYEKVIGLLKFTKIIKKMPDVNFYFAGNGPYIDMVKQNCPSNMFLLGWISNSGTKSLLESGDIFVHPSGLDAFPRSVKEASLMEKPIVASNVGGIPEIVINNQTGYLCDIDDVDQWIGRIRFLLDNPDVARRLGKNAREYVENTFSWRKIAESFVENVKAFRE
jgi:glycosyltransferase involved in cell wall biosynthesis